MIITQNNITKKIKSIINLIFVVKQQILSKNKNSLNQICVRILNSKFHELGILKLTHCFLTKIMTENDLLKRKILNILKIKLNYLNNIQILKIIKKKKVIFKNKIINSHNIFLGVKDEKFLNIKI